MKPRRHDGRILMIGYGAVGRCTLPLLYRHVEIPHDRITIIDFADLDEAWKYAREHGTRVLRKRIEPNTLGPILSEHLSPGDILIDLAWNIGCIDILQWCHEHDVRYVNTSVELWEPEAVQGEMPMARTLYARHMELRRVIGDWGKTGGWKDGPTAVVDHGANPGWVQHCAKKALADLAERHLADGRAPSGTEPALELARREGAWGALARALSVRTIHISERDTQVTRQPKEVDEFLNTWSVEGFREEGTAPCEIGWGTHERRLPAGAHHHRDGPRHQICLDRMGINTWVRSIVPKGSSRPGNASFEEIVGMAVRHGEAFSLSEHLTVDDGRGVVLYRPTVHYAYLPCDAALASLHEMRCRNYRIQRKQRLMYGDIVSGQDIMGCLLMGHAYKSWWIGSLLGVEETRRLVPDYPDVNPTTLQVAASVLAVVRWMIDHPREGVKLPDHLPYDVILPEIREYLGTFLSEPFDWTPLDRWTHDATGLPAPPADEAWQFTTFQSRGQI